MKTTKLLLLCAIIVASSCIPAEAQRQTSSRSILPEQLVSDLYRQHKLRSPFFQTRSRALLDKYFTPELAGLIWRDARSSGD